MTDIIEKVVTILEESESFLVPVDWIVEEIKKTDNFIAVSDETLTTLLRNDPRIKIFEKSDLGKLAESKWAPSPEQMRSLGIYQGARVMLKSRVPTKTEIIRFLQQKADQTFEALLKAWEIRPEDDLETEDQLLDALAKAQKLQRELRTIKTQGDVKVVEEDGS